MINNGRSNVTVWAQRVGENSASMFDYPKSALIVPSGSYEIPLEEGVTKIAAALPKGESHSYGFTFFVKNEKQERFTVSGDLVAAWHGDIVSFSTPATTLIPGWKR